ncbi:competence protein ComEC [Polaromonas sp. OV174]|uniref:DNA internalization-related competence protein ComEC/Rec2 n=1 Tax=Polaromonas sp. OV174 TaxID=1855300 RepID=UPI0008E2018D|nr:competence protein ComEC [Polaromonas sp. OV174]
MFRATGVAHLMSISGLHITMFAWAASWLIGALWRRSARLTPRLCLALPASRAGALGGLLLAVLYALFSGWGVPAQRTIWMLATVVLLRQSGRQWPWGQTWLLAMAVVVALDPWALMQAGFWLSFVAVGVLFAAGPAQGKQAPSGGREPREAGERGGDVATDSGAGGVRPQRAEGRFDLKNGLASRFLPPLLHAAREQWVVTLALTPLSLLLFNQVSLVGLLANAVAIPWVTLLVTPLAMLGVLWAPLWDVAAWAVGLLALLLQWLASWPLASVSVAAAPLWCAVAGVLGGALLALRLPWHWRVLGLPLLLPVLLWQPVRPAPGQFELLAADIGQGNAVLVRTASHSLLYDTGPRFSRESDAGHRVLVPLLRALGERLDLLVLSHRDSDHIGGAPAVLAMQPQARLLSSIEDSHPLQALRPSTRCAAGQHWVWDGVSFDVLHPDAADYREVSKSNAMSCVLRISNGGQTALLVGDIEAAQELRLSSVPASLKADFLLVPHHGSKTSSSALFLDAVQPPLALAQAGYRNRFGHPVASVVARYDERGIRLVRSPQCGAASWQSQKPAELDCQRQAGLRYWQHLPEP